jgi:protein-S-isoprenylcysteine O-methyltransferase Ste14
MAVGPNEASQRVEIGRVCEAQCREKDIMVKKGFYVFPPILTAVNFSILLFVGIVFVKKQIVLWDYLSIAAGGVLVIVFVASLVSTHKVEQVRMKPEDVDKLVTYGPYQLVRHPNYVGLICMNMAYLLFFRTPYLVPFICVFVILWYLEARHEEEVLMAKFGEAYESYKASTGMFFPKLSR